MTRRISAPHWSRPLTVLLAVWTVTACGHPVQRQLQGEWFGEGVENIPADQLAAATAWAKGTRLRFSGDSLRVTIPAQDARTGHFKVARVSDEEIQLQVTRPDGQSDGVRLTLDGEQTMRWQLGNGRSVLLRRED